MPWPDNALPAGAFGKIADLTSGKRVVLMPIDINEAILASKITGPGQRATLSAMLSDGMKAVTIRVNDVEGVAGFVLPGDRVDVVLTRAGEKNNAVNDVVLQNVRVLAVDQFADQTRRQALRGQGGHARSRSRPTDRSSRSRPPWARCRCLLRKAGDAAEAMTRQRDDTRSDDRRRAAGDSHFVTIVVMRPSRDERVEYTRADRGGRRAFGRDRRSNSRRITRTWGRRRSGAKWDL